MLTHTLNFLFSLKFIVFFVGSSIFLKGLAGIVAYIVLQPLLTIVVGYVDDTIVDDIIVVILVTLFVFGRIAMLYLRR